VDEYLESEDDGLGFLESYEMSGFNCWSGAGEPLLDEDWDR
jgi:hypothetical protein